MKVGILGTGNVAKALGTALTHHGVHVMFGSRTVDKANELAGEMEHFAQGGTIANAIHYGEVIILAIPYKSIESVLRNTDTFTGKVIMDCTNPVVFDGLPELALGFDTSAAEQIQHMVPGARVVKAFNTATAKVMESPYFGANDASMFYCGDDDEAKKAVKYLIEAVGMEAVDCGPLNSARLLEPMAVLLMRCAFGMGMGPEIALKLLKRD